MQKSKIWLFKYFKGISFVLFLMILISFNFILNDALHQKVHASGQQFVKHVYELNLSPSMNNEALAALAKSEGFMLEVPKPAEHFKHLVNIERSFFLQNIKSEPLSLSCLGNTKLLIYIAKLDHIRRRWLVLSLVGVIECKS